jgi:hypothetical protein
VLLDDLLEAGVVQLRELGQIVDVGDDVAQVLFQQVEIFLDRVARLAFTVLLYAMDGIADLFLRGCYAPDNFLGLDALEGVDLVELLLQLLDEALLRFLVPVVVHAQGVLEVIVVDVVEDPLSVERLLELLAEPACSR